MFADPIRASSLSWLHQHAGQKTAPDQRAKTIKFPLATRGPSTEVIADYHREAVVSVVLSGEGFKNSMVSEFYARIKHRPPATFGTFLDEFLAFKYPAFERVDLCSVILNSHWEK